MDGTGAFMVALGIVFALGIVAFFCNNDED